MERRLAAILATDVVVYTRLMGADKTGMLAGLKALCGEVELLIKQTYRFLPLNFTQAQKWGRVGLKTAASRSSDTSSR